MYSMLIKSSKKSFPRQELLPLRWDVTLVPWSLVKALDRPLFEASDRDLMLRTLILCSCFWEDNGWITWSLVDCVPSSFLSLWQKRKSWKSHLKACWSGLFMTVWVMTRTRYCCAHCMLSSTTSVGHNLSGQFVDILSCQLAELIKSSSRLWVLIGLHWTQIATFQSWEPVKYVASCYLCFACRICSR